MNIFDFEILSRGFIFAHDFSAPNSRIKFRANFIRAKFYPRENLYK